MLRLGIVDFDSSHSIEFTRRFNHVGVNADQVVEGARVVAGWPGTSEMSPERIPGFERQIRNCNVDIVEAPEEMIGGIDAVLILSLGGSMHLSRVRPFLEAGIPAYVDKPFACDATSASAMIQLSRANAVPLYHSSALPFSAEMEEFRIRKNQLGKVCGAVCYGPAKRAAGNPGLFHYGIHAVALLFALMGLGCESVANVFADGAEVVTGRWRDGRLGTVRGIREGSTAYGFVAICDAGSVHVPVSTRFAYRNLCSSIVDSLTTGRPVVSHEQNLEETGFVLAALESERRGGEAVTLESVIS